MIAAVLCPGPSLMRRWPDCGVVYDVVFTVNTAAKLVRGDWLCAGDKCFFRGLLGDAPRPLAGIVTCPDSLTDACRWAPSSLVNTWADVPLIGLHARRGRPINWTVQSALCQAHALGAKHVDLYGCDGAAGGRVEDATGYRGEDRTAERWEREERDLAWTKALLAEHGTTINRIEP